MPATAYREGRGRLSDSILSCHLVGSGWKSGHRVCAQSLYLLSHRPSWNPAPSPSSPPVASLGMQACCLGGGGATAPNHSPLCFLKGLAHLSLWPAEQALPPLRGFGVLTMLPSRQPLSCVSDFCTSLQGSHPTNRGAGPPLWQFISQGV